MKRSFYLDTCGLRPAFFESSILRSVVLAAMGSLCLIFPGCDYNVDVQVKVPRWETGTMPVAVLSGHAVLPETGLAQSYSADDCSSQPGRFVLTFVLADERDRSLRQGDRFSVAGETGVLSRDLLLAPGSTELINLTMSVEDAEPVPVEAQILDLGYLGPFDRIPGRLVVLHDHGQTMAAVDPADQRIAAEREVASETLCVGLTDLACGFTEDVEVGMLRLAEGLVTESVAPTRSMDEMVEALDRIQGSVERGAAPLFGLREQHSPGGGLNEALLRCMDEGTPLCWPAMLLLTSSTEESGEWTLDEYDPSLYPDTPFVQGTMLLAASLDDNPALRLAACRTAGAFVQVDDPTMFRLSTKISPTSPVSYGFGRLAVLAMQGRWQILVEVSEPPAWSEGDLVRISGTLQITLRGTARAHDFSFITGGY